MPRLSRRASKRAKKARMHSEMHKFKHRTLHSGSKRGPIVEDRAQAIAISLNESGQSRRKKRGRMRSKRRGSRGRS